jgi:REP element-mobilizing transposase RayT
MPRQARLDIPGALHHIMVRGISKTDIFGDNQDRTRFLERLGVTVMEGQCTVYAWALMTNHVHILFKSGKQGISSVMRKLLTWYAQYYNRRHKRTGHLFENRYKSILCDEDNYLLALVRYIHLNPLRASIVKTIEVYDNYCHANDPHEEHDFGSFEADGHTIFFKIDYFDSTLTLHSPDPSEPSVTKRVITIMLAEEY